MHNMCTFNPELFSNNITVEASERKVVSGGDESDGDLRAARIAASVLRFIY